jgi:hypothetical protein
MASFPLTYVMDAFSFVLYALCLSSLAMSFQESEKAHFGNEQRSANLEKVDTALERHCRCRQTELKY